MFASLTRIVHVAHMATSNQSSPGWSFLAGAFIAVKYLCLIA